MQQRWFQAHPWFRGMQWERLYHIEAAFKPEVNDELDTQNFENFEEVYKISKRADFFHLQIYAIAF